MFPFFNYIIFIRTLCHISTQWLKQSSVPYIPMPLTYDCPINRTLEIGLCPNVVLPPYTALDARLHCGCFSPHRICAPIFIEGKRKQNTAVAM